MALLSSYALDEARVGLLALATAAIVALLAATVAVLRQLRRNGATVADAMQAVLDAIDQAERRATETAVAAEQQTRATRHAVKDLTAAVRLILGLPEASPRPPEPDVDHDDEIADR